MSFTCEIDILRAARTQQNLNSCKAFCGINEFHLGIDILRAARTQQNLNSCKASCGIRTHDLPLTERVLYQLSERG